jgi:hypothetical protein
VLKILQKRVTNMSVLKRLYERTAGKEGPPTINVKGQY